MSNILIRQNHTRKFSDNEHPDGFVTRLEFINRTKIFVTQQAFEDIYERFKEARTDIDEFLDNYKERYAIAVQTDASEIVQFEDYDFAGIGFKPNVYELLNWIVEGGEKNE